MRLPARCCTFVWQDSISAVRFLFIFVFLFMFYFIYLYCKLIRLLKYHLIGCYAISESESELRIGLDSSESDLMPTPNDICLKKTCIIFKRA